MRDIRFNVALVLLHLALVAVVFIAADMLSELNYSKFSVILEANKKTVLWGLACLLTLPIAIFLFFRARALGGSVVDALIPAKIKETSWAESFRRFNGLLFSVVGLIALFVETVMLSGTIMPEQLWAKAVVGLTLLLVGLLGWTRFRYLGEQSLQTLKDVLTKELEVSLADPTAALLDIHTHRVIMGEADEVVGRSLREMNLRMRTGASVIGIERNGRMIINPAADERLSAGDVVVVLGDEEQIMKARDLLRSHFVPL
jgi:hypothetical protein